MNIDNLKEGMIIKNYKELCKVLKIKPTGGSSKKAQLKELAMFVDYEKQGIKYLINEIYAFPKEKEDKRKVKTEKRFKKHYEQFKVSIEDSFSIGVYKITLGNEIYIGSTTTSFRRRFTQHAHKNNPLANTKDLLERGATFEILQICNGMEENEIRRIENDWIEEFRNNPDWIVVNEVEHVKIKGERKEKPKYKKIKVLEEDYEKALEILRENGINIGLDGLDSN